MIWRRLAAWCSRSTMGARSGAGRSDAAVVDRIAAGLVARGVYREAGGAEYRADLRWVSGNGSVTLGAYMMLPDDLPACPADVGV